MRVVWTITMVAVVEGTKDIANLSVLWANEILETLEQRLLRHYEKSV